MSSPVRTLFLVTLSALILAPLAGAESPRDIEYRFSTEDGEDVIQPGCTTFDYEANPCHQIATDMNGLDSPKIDVLIIVPVSPTAERDLRILRQSVEMWADGVEWMARDLGLDWMADGVEFHIFAEMMDVSGEGESEFTTYPIVDPEIVVIGTNPVGGIGIGIDPVDFAGIIFGEGAGEGPCHGVQNPFDMELWENLPGYDSHHNGRGGTYVEDCDGAGGNVCFSVNGAIDPATSVIDIFQLYDLASHETGHCLTLGHVGDGAEGSWSSVPTNDIMAYSTDPPGVSKCVSSLNVEGLAVTMSKYLDVDGDGEVTPDDRIYANDAIGEGDGRPFQIQHPDNHIYASPTRQAIDCPQPDMSPVPLSEVVNFTPDAPARPSIAFDGLFPMAHIAPGPFTLAGHINGTGATEVRLSVRAPPDAVNQTEGAWLLPNVTAPVEANGSWSADVDFAALPEGLVIVAAQWFDAEGELVDADRVDLVVDPMLADSPSLDGGQDRDVPGVAFAALLLALAGLAAVRRR